MTMKFNQEIAEFTRTLQSQNGLRHGDYHRYRHFCTRKVHRTRKSLKMTNGRHRFKMAVMPEVINSPRYVQLLILRAERAWAHGLTLKSEFAIGESRALGRIRHRYIRKFYKAARVAGEVLSQAKKFCDARTILEASAYYSWMTALALTEDAKYEQAIEEITSSTAKYTELISTSLESVFPSAAKAFKHRVSDLEPTMRVCKYKLRLSQALPMETQESVHVSDASPRSAGGFESIGGSDMSDEGEGEVEFNSSSESDEQDLDVSPRSAKNDTAASKGLLGKIGGWWNKS